MMLGKRSRPSMRRTTSMSVLSDDGTQPSDHEFPPENEKESSAPPPSVPTWAAEGKKEVMCSGKSGKKTQKSRRAASVDGNVNEMGMIPSKSAPLVMASFLRACGLCKKKLGPGRDTFMYRGEIAFCSLECRQHQMAIDERKEKCSISSMKKTPSQGTARTKPSNGFNTAAA